MLAGMIFYMYIIHKTCDELLSKLDTLNEIVKDDDWDHAEKQLDLIQNTWKKNKKWMTTLIDHQELSSIESSLAMLSQYLHSKETVEYLAESAQLRVFIKHISDHERISISNLF